MGEALLFIFVACLVTFAGFVFSRFRESAKLGQQHEPLSADDRLRIVLALRMLEEAERELAKAAWINHTPGNARCGLLLGQLNEVTRNARQYLRGES